MNTYIVLFFLAFLGAYLGTPLLSRLLERWGVLDSSVTGRPHVRRPVPRLGGVVLYAAVVGSLALLLVPSNLVTVEFRSQLSLLWKLLAPATLILLVGVADDLWGVSARAKLLVQTGAALWLFFQGVRISHVALPWGGSWELGWFSVGVTLLWLVGLTNAFNFIDGLDGLAAGTAFLSACAIAATAIMINHRMVVVISLALAGALLGFLRHNFSPARIFLGDSGSLFVGFLLAGTAVAWHQKTTTAIAVVVPVLAFTLPIADVTLAVLRRSLRGQPIFLSDREHIHHRLLAHGLSSREALLLLYITSGAAAFGCVLILEGNVLITTMVLLCCLAVFVVLGYWLAYPEFMELVRRLPGRPMNSLRAWSWLRVSRAASEPPSRPESGEPAFEGAPGAGRGAKNSPAG